MRYFKHILLTGTTILAGCLPLSAQQTKLLAADKHNDYGLVYTLPKTSLKITVTATKEVRKAGPYYQYAKKYIGTDDVVKEDAEVWTINAVDVVSFGKPDKANRYLMQLKPGATTFIGVDADGMLLSINTNPWLPVKVDKGNAPGVEGEVIADKEYLRYVDEDFIASQSQAKQAQMLAESLMEIRDAKISLTRGTADQMPTDGRQLELMLNSLTHQEAAITAAFLGNITRETVVREFVYTPEGDTDDVLFRMSSFAGFVDADDYSGDPVTIKVEVTDRGDVPTDAKGEAKKLPKDAIAYNVPGAGKFTISHKGVKLFSGEFEIAQFGVTFGLQPTLFSDKKAPSYAIFDPATGALKEIGTVSQTAE